LLRRAWHGLLSTPGGLWTAQAYPDLLISFRAALGGNLRPLDAATAISGFNQHLGRLGAQTKGQLIAAFAGLPLDDINLAV